jgi:hypothetical protein
MTRHRTAADRRELESLTDEYVRDGYQCTVDEPDKAVVKARGLGSLWVHLFLLVFTVGFGNVAYGLYRYLTPDIVVIEVE